ncbi:MAG TPA: type II toxin-antitoxin system HicA family toxin [Bryobacteraceae bacterium]|nr:type II toxin-antitoxin system HicA family toxin [Bryobacteraceae bacterium]
MKVRDAIKLIETQGWKHKRTHGDHRVYTHPTKPGIVVVPGHASSDLAAGTLSSILKQAGFEMKYAVVIEKTDTGYSAYVPDLPGCVSVGGTREEMDRNIREAIELYLDELREQGAPIPAPTTDTEYVTV